MMVVLDCSAYGHFSDRGYRVLLHVVALLLKHGVRVEVAQRVGNLHDLCVESSFTRHRAECGVILLYHSKLGRLHWLIFMVAWVKSEGITVKLKTSLHLLGRWNRY
jgi:hypothetical protein